MLSNSEYYSNAFWLSVGSPISPDVRPSRRRGAKIWSQFWVRERERVRESENLYGQLKSPLYPSNFRQRLRIHDSQWPLVSVQDWLQLGQSLVRIAANLICSIYLLSHLSFMPKTLCPIIELYIYKLVKNLSKMDSFRLCKLSTHCPQVIRTSETWGKPQTLKKS